MVDTIVAREVSFMITRAADYRQWPRRMMRWTAPGDLGLVVLLEIWTLVRAVAAAALGLQEWSGLGGDSPRHLKKGPAASSSAAATAFNDEMDAAGGVESFVPPRGRKSKGRSAAAPATSTSSTVASAAVAAAELPGGGDMDVTVEMQDAASVMPRGRKGKRGRHHCDSQGSSYCGGGSAFIQREYE
jgi:hypothetical protein